MTDPTPELVAVFHALGDHVAGCPDCPARLGLGAEARRAVGEGPDPLAVCGFWLCRDAAPLDGFCFEGFRLRTVARAALIAAQGTQPKVLAAVAKRQRRAARLVVP